MNSTMEWPRTLTLGYNQKHNNRECHEDEEQSHSSLGELNRFYPFEKQLDTVPYALAGPLLNIYPTEMSACAYQSHV